MINLTNMITIIHGDDISQSRSYFQDLKKKQKNIVSFSSQITITDIVQNIEGSGLFSDTKNIVIEDFLTKLKKADGNAKQIINFIIKNSQEFNFALWESKEILKKDLLQFKNAEIKNFKLPKNIFLFLDNLKPNNSKSLINLFHQALDSGIKEELILFMTQRQMRLLLAIPDSQNDKLIEELIRIAPWQMEKLERQAKLFNKDNLKKIYKKLYEIEIAQKTGALSLSLVQTIDFLLLEM